MSFSDLRLFSENKMKSTGRDDGPGNSSKHGVNWPILVEDRLSAGFLDDFHFSIFTEN